MEYEAVIGLEVHAQLLTHSKIFCGCSTSFGQPPNTQTCPVCLGMPGSLPALNKKAVEFALKMALAVNCEIAPESVFARKNYFYPDLPKGYQISQYELPLAEHGHLNIGGNGVPRRIGITRIHLEEDAGKLIHSESRPVSLVDFNRTGVPLIEIVSEPDIRSPEEASQYLKALRDILVYLEICDGNMEEGSLRCDANVSLRPVGRAELGTKAELKNINSFRFVKLALEYEIRRQRALLNADRKIVQETRLWDAAQNQTVSMRGKEEAHDYRYFPDPDLVPVRIDNEWLESLRTNLPELPGAKRLRFQTQYGLPEYDAEVLTGDKARADKFESTLTDFPHLSPKQVSNWFLDDPASMSTITPGTSGTLLTLVEKGAISRNQAKEVLREVVATGKDPEAIIKEKGLVQITDTGALQTAAQEIIAAHPKEAADYKAGKAKVMGFFVGQLMKKTKGQANPQLANEVFQKLLEQ